MSFVVLEFYVNLLFSLKNITRCDDLVEELDNDSKKKSRISFYFIDKKFDSFVEDHNRLDNPLEWVQEMYKIQLDNTSISTKRWWHATILISSWSWQSIDGSLDCHLPTRNWTWTFDLIFLLFHVLCVMSQYELMISQFIDLDLWVKIGGTPLIVIMIKVNKSRSSKKKLSFPSKFGHNPLTQFII